MNVLLSSAGDDDDDDDYTPMTDSVEGDSNHDNLTPHDEEEEEDDDKSGSDHPIEVMLRQRLFNLLQEFRIYMDEDDTEQGLEGEEGDGQRSDLSNVPMEVLQQCVKPVLDGLQVIDAESLLELDRTNSPETGAILCKGIHVKPIHSEIQPALSQSSSQLGSTVRYIHLGEIPGRYSIGIFVFPPNVRMPLHDHPGMCVLSRLLYGSLERTSLDLSRDGGDADGNENNPEMAAAAHMQEAQERGKRTVDKSCSSNNSNPGLLSSLWQRMSDRLQLQQQQPIPKEEGHKNNPIQGAALPSRGMKRAYHKRVDYLHAPDCAILYPVEGNLHQFTAGPEGAAVLDVLVPPYDEEELRDCNYYEIWERPQQLSTTATTTQEQPPLLSAYWIRPIVKPENFHCVRGQYRCLGSSS